MTCCNHQCNEGRDCPEKQTYNFFWVLGILGILLLATAYVIWKIF